MRNIPDEVDLQGESFSRWLDHHCDDETVARAEALPVRRDMVTLLTYVRDTKVVGTRSTGNMPRKHVREVTARFVDPPELDVVIGDYRRTLQSEYDVWPLYFLHILADVGGLVTAEPGRLWRLTAEGEAFLKSDPLPQAAFLYGIWCHETNWLVAYSFTGMGETLPPYFEWITLSHLHALPTREPIRFDAFADRVIEMTGLTWASPIEPARKYLRNAIKRMVVNILAQFGGVDCRYTGQRSWFVDIRELVEFEITPFGRMLLDSALAMRAGLQPQWRVGMVLPSPGSALVVRRLGRDVWTFEFPRLGDEAYEAFYEALDTWHAGHLAEAEVAYRRLVVAYPEFIDLYHHLALLLSYSGRKDEAYQVWEIGAATGIKRLPKRLKRGHEQLPWGFLDNRPFLRTCHGLALEHLERKKVDRALELLERILAWNPSDNQGVRALVIDIYFQQGRPERVLDVCERYPEDVMEQVLYGRALALYQLGRKAEAEAALCEAVEWLPLVAEELTKVHYEPPAELSGDFVIHGGPGQAYLYWEEQGQHWEETPGAIEFVAACLQKGA